MPARSETVDDVHRLISASGLVIRWREAHPDEEDILAEPFKKIREALGGTEKLVCSPSCALLMFRKQR